LLVQRKIELLDGPVFLRQLRALEERRMSNGNIYIRPSYNQKDDLGVAVALGAFELAKRLPPRDHIVEVILAGGPYQSSFARQKQLERGWFRIGY
jgi:hypothetical protein